MRVLALLLWIVVGYLVMTDRLYLTKCQYLFVWLPLLVFLTIECLA